MKRFFGNLLVGVVLACVLGGPLALPSQAGTFRSGYTFAHGLYWKGGQAFVRNQVLVRNQFGVLQNQYQYTPFTQTADWRNKLLEIARQRDAQAVQLQAAAQEQAEFLAAIKALGLSGNYSGYADNYHSGVHTADPHYPTEQGQTVFGYSMADVYNDVDLRGLYEQALRLAQDANQYGAQATANAHALIQQEGAWRAEVARILANKAQSTVPRATAQVDHDTEYRIRIPRDGGPPVIEPAGPAMSGGNPNTGASLDGPENLQSLVTDRCVACHGADRQEGRLDLRDLAKITPDQGARVLTRIIDPDPTKRMPPVGKKQLSVAELLQFFNAAKTTEDGN